MFGWLYTKFEKLHERRKNQVRCKRCRSFYAKSLETCNVCDQLSDTHLASALRERRSFRLTLGTCMLTGAALLVLVMLVFALG